MLEKLNNYMIFARFLAQARDQVSQAGCNKDRDRLGRHRSSRSALLWRFGRDRVEGRKQAIEVVISTEFHFQSISLFDPFRLEHVSV